MIPLPDPRDELRERIAAEVEYELGRAIKDWSPTECAERILALPSAPEPAEPSVPVDNEIVEHLARALRMADCVSHRDATGDTLRTWDRLAEIEKHCYRGEAERRLRSPAPTAASEPAETGELDEFGVEEAAIALMEMVGGPGVPDHYAARIAIEAYLRVVRSPATPRPMECSVCGAGYIGSRAGEECGVEGCDGRLYFVVAETGERDGYVMVPTQLLRTEWPPTPQLAPGHKRFDAVYESLLAGAPIREPLAVRYDNWTVIDGHHRIAAARLLGIDVVPVRFWTGAAWVPPASRSPAPTAAEPEREAPTPETERLFEAVLYGVRCGRGAVNDAACESIAREVIAALTTPEAEGGSK